MFVVAIASLAGFFWLGTITIFAGSRYTVDDPDYHPQMMLDVYTSLILACLISIAGIIVFVLKRLALGDTFELTEPPAKSPQKLGKGNFFSLEAVRTRES